MSQEIEFQDSKTRSQPPPYTSGVPVTVVQQPQMMQQGPVVYQTNAAIVPLVVTKQMSPTSSPMTCVSCNQQINTRVESRATTKTHLFAALLCIIGCWPCVFIPYCVDSCRNTNHYCPNCNAYIGTYSH